LTPSDQTPDASVQDSDDVSESRLAFPDNYLLIDLCGEFDRNLATIEDRMSVQILRRGNELAVIGEEQPRKESRPAKSWLNHAQMRKKPMCNRCLRKNWPLGLGLPGQAKPILPSLSP